MTMDYTQLHDEAARLLNLTGTQIMLSQRHDVAEAEAADALEPLIIASLRVLASYSDASYVVADDGVRYDMKPNRR
jgi:hypothetical protein